MHRPTRKHRNLQVKLARKLAESRGVGKKARRWKKWIAEYEKLVKERSATS